MLLPDHLHACNCAAGAGVPDAKQKHHACQGPCTDILVLRRFTDKPIRRAGAFETAYFASSETFASDGVWLGAPNAALTGTDDAGQPYVVVLTLYSPVYSNQGHTLEYQVIYYLGISGKGQEKRQNCTSQPMPNAVGASCMHAHALC